VKKWVGYARLDPNVEAVRELLGQSIVSATSAYLNVGKRRALEIAKQLEM